MLTQIVHAVGGRLRTIASVWQAVMWLRNAKKELDRHADERLTEENAASLRLTLEKVFHALETGNGNLKRLPRVVRWLFSQTTADNRLGWFGMRVLKSEKLSRRDPILNEPIDKEVFTWRNPPKG